MLNKHFFDEIENKVPRLKPRARYTFMKDEIVIMYLILSIAFLFLPYDSFTHMLTKCVPNLIPGRQKPN